MKKYNYIGVFFSPTGGTKNALELLGSELDNDFKTIDLTLKKDRDVEYVFDDCDIVIVSAPVYAGRLPMVQNLFSNLKGNNTKAVVMATYGNRHYDDTLVQMKDILSKNGFKVIAGITPIIPHVYSNKLGKNRPDFKDIKVFKEFSYKLNEKLKEDILLEIDLPGNKDFEVFENKPGGKIEKVFKKDLCNDCKMCINECPVSCIGNDGMIDKNLCINCMKCVAVCKVGARDFIPTDIRKYLEENYLDRKEIEYFL